VAGYSLFNDATCVISAPHTAMDDGQEFRWHPDRSAVLVTPDAVPPGPAGADTGPFEWPRDQIRDRPLIFRSQR